VSPPGLDVAAVAALERDRSAQSIPAFIARCALDRARSDLIIAIGLAAGDRPGAGTSREYRGAIRGRTIRSMEARDLAVGLPSGRIAIGAVSLLAPGFVGRTMIGRAGSEGGTRLFARMLGARDLGLGLGVLVALDRDAPVRGWLEASATVDGIDAAACLLARRHIRTSVFPGVVGLAAAGALLGAWLAEQLDPTQSPPSGPPDR
jgi:hypothetical protein